MTAPYGWWPCDDDPVSDGVQVGDSSGNANHGTLHTDNGTTNKSVAGKIGKAIQLDGTADYISIANESNFDFNQQSFTVAAWVKDVTGFGVLISKGTGGSAGGWRVALDNTGYVEALTRKSDDTDIVLRSGTASPNFNDGAWHHIAVVIAFDTVTAGNNSATVYVNGVLLSTADTGSGGTPSLNNNVVKIGTRASSGEVNGLYLPGTVDDVRVYNVGLSAGEIAEIGALGAELHADHRLMAIP